MTSQLLDVLEHLLSSVLVSHSLLGHVVGEEHVGMSIAHDYDGHCLSLSLGSEKGVAGHDLGHPLLLLSFLVLVRLVSRPSCDTSWTPISVWEVERVFAAHLVLGGKSWLLNVFGVLRSSPLPRHPSLFPALPPPLRRRLLPLASPVRADLQGGANGLTSFPLPGETRRRWMERGHLRAASVALTKEGRCLPRRLVLDVPCRPGQGHSMPRTAHSRCMGTNHRSLRSILRYARWHSWSKWEVPSSFPSARRCPKFPLTYATVVPITPPCRAHRTWALASGCRSRYIVIFAPFPRAATPHDA